MTDLTHVVPLWLDCDPGHDDAFALLLALHHPRTNLLGVSTVHGNASLANTTNNALSLLAAFGRADVPVCPGAAKPYSRDAVHAEDIHGKSGLEGTVHLPKPSSAAQYQKPAIITMHDALLSQEPNTVWIVATGALTNVALLFAVFPELVKRIAGLTIMGGAVGGNFTKAPMGKVDKNGAWKERVGNWSEWAEFNIYCDPESASSVFSNPSLASKTTLIPLDLTHQVLATPDIRMRLLYPQFTSPITYSTPFQHYPPASPPRQLLHSIISFFAKSYASIFGITEGPPLHDPLAVAVILDALGLEDFGLSYFAPDDEDGNGNNNKPRWQVRVVTDGEHALLEKDRDEDVANQLGRTIVTLLTEEGDGKGGIRIPRRMKGVERFWEVLLECAARVEEKTKGKAVYEGWEVDDTPVDGQMVNGCQTNGVQGEH